MMAETSTPTPRWHAWMGIVVALLMIPLVCSSPAPDETNDASPKRDGDQPGRPGHALRFGLPRVYAGDEPHYLLMTHSLQVDGDLDLANNYANALAGGYQAGTTLALRPLPHHVAWHTSAGYRTWSDVYEFAERHPSPSNPATHDWQLKPKSGTVSRIEPPSHPVGLPILLAILTFPARNTPYVEPLAIFMACLAMLLALRFFYLLLSDYHLTPAQIGLIAATTFLGSPLWHHGRTLLPEPFLALCVVGAYAVALRKNSGLAAGGLLAVGMLLQPSVVWMGLPLIAYFVARRAWASAAMVAPPLVVCWLTIAALNQAMWGDWTAPPRPWQWGEFANVFWLWIDPHRGLLTCAPAAVLAIWGWRQLWRERRGESATLLGGFATWFVLAAADGSSFTRIGFGPAALVPALPLLFVGVAPLLSAAKGQGVARRVCIGAIVVVSVLFNLIAAIPYWCSWGMHPLASFGGP